MEVEQKGGKITNEQRMKSKVREDREMAEPTNKKPIILITNRHKLNSYINAGGEISAPDVLLSLQPAPLHLLQS